MDQAAIRDSTSDHKVAGIATFKRKCSFCEASCGVLVEADARNKRVLRVRGDEHDPLSRGFICAKAYAWTELNEDPNIIRTPLIRRGKEFEPASWEEALALVGDRLGAIRHQYGPNSIGFYFGTPITHKPSLALYAPPLLQALGTTNIFSSGSVDANPKFLSSGLMFGDCSAVSIPDVDRTNFLVIHGANPVASGGSLVTAPGMPKRIKAIRARGGKVVVIDPRRTETADIADQHIAIRPGTDPFLLLAVINVLFAEGLVRLGAAQGKVRGIETIRALAVDYPPERVASACAIPANVIRELARQFAAADGAAWYGRFGTCVQRFGSIASLLQDVITILTGNIDRPGGAMFGEGVFPAQLFADKFVGETPPVGRWHTRVRGLPEVSGMVPSVTMIEEIMTPGEGKLRAMFTMAANPVLSNPNSLGLAEAFSQLDFMVSLDIYLNETTRHAHVILPSPPQAAHSDFAVFLVPYMVRNVPKWSPPIFDLDPGQMPDWKILLDIAARISGVTVDEMEETFVQDSLKRFAVEGTHPKAASIDPAAARKQLDDAPGPDRIYDIMIRTGRFGDAFGLDPQGLNLEKLKQHPHGLDLGAMQPRLDAILRTPDKKIDLAPAHIMADVDALKAELPNYEKYEKTGSMLMIGRRHVRSNNSWMHNLHVLMKGKNRCTVMMHRDDATRLKLETGAMARVSTATGSIDIPVEITNAMMPGVVSIPHGFGHDMEGTALDIAQRNPGANYNQIIDQIPVDVPSGNGVLTGIPVTIAPVIA